MLVQGFSDMVSAAQSMGPIRIGVAAPHDLTALRAVIMAQQEGIVVGTLTGDAPAIKELAAENGLNLSQLDIIDEPDPVRACKVVVSLARDGQLDAVVKGQVKTTTLLGTALRHDIGIRDRRLLSHVGIFELPSLDRLIYISDTGVVVQPDVSQKLEIIRSVVAVAHSFGIVTPRVAILAASETVHPKIPASIDALALARMAEQGWVEGAVVDGPVGLEAAISPVAAQLDGSDSPIAGLADVLIVPNVEAGNIMAKGLQYFAGARMAGLVVGARVPILISSRADTAETRYLSLAMAAVLVRQPTTGEG
ncbi:bifunctional enoyl-CoA hydratase/phosphate acetyltransferase [Chloroflexota bacterium]